MLANMNRSTDELRETILAGCRKWRETDWGRFLAEWGDPLWLVGGVVRDLALGLDPPDIDILSAKNAIILGKRMAEKLNGRFVLLHEDFGSCRVVLPNEKHVDFTDMQGASLEEDLRRRDLTINAIAVPWPQIDQIIDPTGGLDDLTNRIARLASPGVIAQDPVRTLRVFRFASAFDLSIDPDVLTEINSSANLLNTMPGERIWEELEPLLAVKKCAFWLRGMEQNGIIDALFPEVADCAGVKQPAFHHLPVREHCLEAAYFVDELTEEALFPEVLDDPHSRAILRLAALLHDVAKPETALEQNGRLRYPDHSARSAKLADQACRRLRLSNADRKRVIALVQAHMRPHQLADLLADDGLSPRATRKFLTDMGEDWLLTIALAKADQLATAGPKAPTDGPVKLHSLLLFLSEAAKLSAAIDKQPLITGKDVLAMGIPAGEKIGQILDAAAQAHFENPAMTREEALALVKTIADKP